MIGKKLVESRPVTLTEVSEIMNERLEEAEEEFKARKKEKKVVEKVPEPPPAAEGPEGAEGAPVEGAPVVAVPVPAPVEEKSPLGLEQRSALEYAKKFSKLGKRKAAEMMEKLSKVEKMKPEIAVKVVDLLPSNVDQLKLLFAKERVTADDKLVAQVLKLVEEFKK